MKENWSKAKTQKWPLAICTNMVVMHIGNIDFGFWVKHKRKYIIHRDFVLARNYGS